jgi:leucyl-tRNA synthetase
MVLAPEHALVDKLTGKAERKAVDAYRAQAAAKSELERSELQKDKSGVFTGAHAINPANGAKIPIWIADYVLAGYGTGAIMSVPAQDQRDFEFAQKFGLPIVRTVEPPAGFEGEAWTGDGTCINSGFLDGLRVEAAKAGMIDWLEQGGRGERRINYKLRDWLFSRQRYWGEPFPVVFVDGEARTLPENALPVTLPELEDFKPSGSPEGPLAKARHWLETQDPVTGRAARRETNTMPQWAGSCWYYLRFIDPENPEQLVDPRLEKYWMPVDLYVGGAEHAVLHLLYARFWHMVLHDAGVISTPEPFVRLVHQGMILGELEYTVDGERVDESKVEKQGDRFVLRSDPSVTVEARAFKMSKSRGNVVNPDEILARHGADAFRLYEMFLGPLEQVKPWSTRGVEGTFRFLNRAWRLFIAGDEWDSGVRTEVVDAEASTDQLKLLHRTIAKVTGEIEALRFNTAIASLMEFTNAANKWPTIPRPVADSFVLLLAPLAPHVAEELWQRLGHAESLAYAPWPVHDAKYLVDDRITVAVQINGKVRGTIEIAADADEAAVLEVAKADAGVSKHLAGATIRKAIYVRGRIVNFVVG